MRNSVDNSIGSQLRRNAVALISLVVAIAALSYNTWRNEKSEDNRNHRQAAFEILLKLNELQQVVFHHRYDGDTTDKGNPRLGWTYVLTIRDLALILNTPLPEEAEKLRLIWGDNWDHLADTQDSVDAVLDGVDAMRTQTLQLIKSLD